MNFEGISFWKNLFNNGYEIFVNIVVPTQRRQKIKIKNLTELEQNIYPEGELDNKETEKIQYFPHEISNLIYNIYYDIKFVDILGILNISKVSFEDIKNLKISYKLHNICELFFHQEQSKSEEVIFNDMKLIFYKSFGLHHILHVDGVSKGIICDKPFGYHKMFLESSLTSLHGDDLFYNTEILPKCFEQNKIW